MFLTGLGIGPTFSVLTIVIQSVVPFDELGVATGNLTFFRQIGGSVGLAIVGTVFGQSLRDKLPGQLKPVLGQITSQGAATVPGAGPADASRRTLASGSTLDLNNLTGVGQSFGRDRWCRASLRNSRPSCGHYSSRTRRAFNDAFSLAVAPRGVHASGLSPPWQRSQRRFSSTRSPLRGANDPVRRAERPAEGAESASRRRPGHSPGTKHRLTSPPPLADAAPRPFRSGPFRARRRSLPGVRWARCCIYRRRTRIRNGSTPSCSRRGRATPRSVEVLADRRVCRRARCAG